jgi:hypothetical protein
MELLHTVMKLFCTVMKLLCTVVARACLACLSKQALGRRHFVDADAP